MDTPLWAAMAVAAVFALGASAFVTWASGKSAVWNVLFAVLLVTALTAIALAVIRALQIQAGW